MVLTTPDTIRTLQRKLYAKAKQEPASRLYSSGLALGAYLGVKNIGKPCAGKLHARFDEGGQDFCEWTTLNGHEAGNGGHSQG